jgi:outer membrane biosynthesis protein TonB
MEDNKTVVSEELEKSLRDAVDGYINSRLNGLQEEIARLQSQVNEAFTRLLERSSSETQSDTSIAVSISESIRAAHERGIEDAAAESARTKASSDMAILKSAIDDLDNQRSQADILNTLVNTAASFAPRVVFFVVKNEQAVGWRGRGLEGTVGDNSVREIVLPLSADTPLSDVVRSRATWSGTPGANAEDHLLLNKLGTEPPQRIVAVPLIARGKAVAVLYADSAALESDAINLEALETLVRVAGMSVELLSVQRPAPMARPARVEVEAPASPPPQTTPEPQPAEETAQATETATSEEEAPAATQEEEAIAAAAPPPPPAPQEETEEATAQSTETAAPEAAPEQEAAPAAPAEAGAASESAQTPTPSQFSAPLGVARRYGSADTELPVDVSDEERRLHNDARRFARLLVSEIKLYNEQKVKEGRSQGNIYERLREDIDRSRQMYDKRVAPPVAARYDYFHQELVNTLAEGDPSKLGDEYPGATASA